MQEFPRIYNFPPFFTRQPNEQTWKAQQSHWISLILAYCRYHSIWVLNENGIGESQGVRILDREDEDGSNSLQSPEGNTSSTQPVDDEGEITGLFSNTKINRKLKRSVIRDIFSAMVESGDAEWVDVTLSGQKKRFSFLPSGQSDRQSRKSGSILVYWRKPEEWASIISNWIDKTGQNGAVLTIYELQTQNIEQEEEAQALAAAGEVESMRIRGIHEMVLMKSLEVLSRRGKCQFMKDRDGEIMGVKFK